MAFEDTKIAIYPASGHRGSEAVLVFGRFVSCSSHCELQARRRIEKRGNASYAYLP
jgi:hypothetical protein